MQAALHGLQRGGPGEVSAVAATSHSVLLVDITQAEGPGLCYFVIIFRAVLHG